MMVWLAQKFVWLDRLGYICLTLVLIWQRRCSQRWCDIWGGSCEFCDEQVLEGEQYVNIGLSPRHHGTSNLFIISKPAYCHGCYYRSPHHFHKPLDHKIVLKQSKCSVSRKGISLRAKYPRIQNLLFYHQRPEIVSSYQNQVNSGAPQPLKSPSHSALLFVPSAHSNTVQSPCSPNGCALQFNTRLFPSTTPSCNILSMPT
jgi:hypothetical protein